MRGPLWSAPVIVPARMQRNKPPSPAAAATTRHQRSESPILVATADHNAWSLQADVITCAGSPSAIDSASSCGLLPMFASSDSSLMPRAKKPDLPAAHACFNHACLASVAGLKISIA